MGKARQSLSICRPFYLYALNCILLASFATGQTDPQPEKGHQVLDEVVVTMGDKAILWSTLNEAYTARLTGLMAGGKTFNTNERVDLWREVLKSFIGEAVRSQAVKTVGKFTPDQVEEIVNREMETWQERRIQEQGSLNKFRESLKKLGESEFTLRARARNEVYQQIARYEMEANLRDRRALMVTPAEMRKLYLKKLPEMQISASARLGMMSLKIQDPSQADEVLAKANKIIQAWGKESISSKQMAQRYGALAQQDRHIQDSGNKTSTAPWILDFVKGAKAGQVSQPIQRPTSIWILKLLEREGAQKYSFNDPKVQESLRLEILQQKEERLWDRQLEDNKRRVAYRLHPTVLPSPPPLPETPAQETPGQETPAADPGPQARPEAIKTPPNPAPETPSPPPQDK